MTRLTGTILNTNNIQNSEIVQFLVSSLYFYLDLEFVRYQKGKWCSDGRNNVLKEFKADSSSTSPEDLVRIRNQCEDYCETNESCWGCSVACGSDAHMDINAGCQWNAIPSCGDVHLWAGLIEGDISRRPGITLFVQNQTVIN